MFEKASYMRKKCVFTSKQRIFLYQIENLNFISKMLPIFFLQSTWIKKYEMLKNKFFPIWPEFRVSYGPN